MKNNLDKSENIIFKYIVEELKKEETNRIIKNIIHNIFYDIYIIFILLIILILINIIINLGTFFYFIKNKSI
tara:strand:- start:74 stop:289 length:216 start_codon:yes stop_codon:yes gene_type:complete